MFSTPDAWVWDFWFADDGARYHLFFLYASRALHDPDARHLRASIGHAVSEDLITWERVADALVRSDPPAPDDVATWTGSIVRAPDGAWHLFYTGVTWRDGGFIQTVCRATSPDLLTWRKDPHNPIVVPDSRWYETWGDGTWADQAWRDPWVFADPHGSGWHMFVTARSRSGAGMPSDDVLDRGVVGHATSPDLTEWTVQEPLSAPGAGFGQAEVIQIADVDGQPILLFSCLATELAGARRVTGGSGGIWALAADSVIGPFDLGRAVAVTDDSLYVGRLLQDRSGRWLLFAFRNRGPDGSFVGAITDPMPFNAAAITAAAPRG